MDAEAFQTRFAIDHEQLRAGGRAIVEGGGDIGGVLFAAGAGIAQVGAVRRGLNEAAEELFKPNGSKPPINRGLHDLKEWRRQIRQAQLPSAEWQRLQAALDAATAANAQAQQELSAKSAEKGRLERMAEAAPLVA